MRFFKDFFYFNKRERNGIIILLSLIFLTILLRVLLPQFYQTEQYDFTEFKKEIEKITIIDSISHVKIELSKFDPNNISTEQGLKLGFSENHINSWKKYLSKGGGFKTKDDLKKLFFINDSIYRVLEPFIEIEKTSNVTKDKEESLFYFNPNNLPNDYWLQLGFKDWQIRIIKNYEYKGGRFRKDDDLKNMYGVDSLLYHKLRSFIVIYNDSAFISSIDEIADSIEQFTANGNQYYGKWKSNQSVNKLVKRYGIGMFVVFNKSEIIPYEKVVDQSLDMQTRKPQKENIVINVNQDDSIEWRSLRGIGVKLSSRIIDYRDKLRGFNSLNQIKEVYGISDSLFISISKNLVLDQNNYPKININTCDYKELVSHPYIKSKVANSLVNYRQSHGLYRKVEDIKASVLVNDELYLKIAPYLTVE